MACLLASRGVLPALGLCQRRIAFAAGKSNVPAHAYQTAPHGSFAEKSPLASGFCLRFAWPWAAEQAFSASRREPGKDALAFTVKTTLPVVPVCLELSDLPVESIHMTRTLQPAQHDKAAPETGGTTVNLLRRLWIILAAALVALASGRWAALEAAPPSLQTPRAAAGAWASDQPPPPALVPPDTVAGSWISDDAATPPQPPVNVRGGQAYVSDESVPTAQAYEAIASDCAPPAMRGGHPSHGLCRSQEGGYGDLWSEVNHCQRGWVRFDALSWQAKGSDLPPLVTTSPLGTPQDQAGVLPESVTTAVLFGNEEIDGDERMGSRLSVGYWLVEGQFVGIEANYFRLENESSSFFASSTFSDGTQPEDQILARPFFNAETGLQDSALVAFPDFSVGGVLLDLDGSVDIRTDSETDSAALLVRKLLWVNFKANYRVDWLAGYRFFRLDDSITINDSFTTIGGLLAETRFDSTDEFSAKNRFHGGELGLIGQLFQGRWSLEVLGKLALGSNRQAVRINGVNSITTLGVTTTTPGGLLTQPTNIGEFERGQFAVLPEGGLNLRFDVTRRLRASIGISAMYLSDVVRSGGQIDVALNPSQLNGGTLSGEARPAFNFAEDSFWLRGVNAGLEYRF